MFEKATADALAAVQKLQTLTNGGHARTLVKPQDRMVVGSGAEAIKQAQALANNWDLVDTSAPYIVGEHLVSRSRRALYRLAKSLDLWERRIAMVATAAFIDRGDLNDTFAIATQLLADKHDLIHKAIGWMLRRVIAGRAIVGSRESKGGTEATEK